MNRTFHCVAFFVVAGCNVFAQNAESGDASRGFTLYERFQGSVNTLGAVNQLDTSLGYNFNSHFSVDGGIPVYFVRPSSTTAATMGTSSSNGIGNAYAQLRLTVAHPALNFATTLKGTAPTGDKATGFSTGHATVDWSNYFDHSFSRFTPFAILGVANSISDTMFFIRPYTTYGLVTHGEGGARYRAARAVSLGVSVYGIQPSGKQTVVSRLVKAQKPAPAVPVTTAPVTTGRKNPGVFETASTTTGSADIARDHGFSTWAQVNASKSFDLYAGYTRSAQYSLDTIFFGVSLNLGKAVRSLGN